MILWGPWQEHDGKGCPLAIGTVVEVDGETFHSRERRGSKMVVSKVDHERPSPWFADDFGARFGKYNVGRVIRYRTRRYEGAAKLIATLTDKPTEEA